AKAHNSLLIITWDEHGGFYDHVKPEPAVRPNDPRTEESDELDFHGFAFDQYGPRVPAIVISPWIPKGTIDHRLYDHASVPAAIERLFGFPALTDRDATANSPLDLCTLSEPRTEPPERPRLPVAGGGGINEGKPPLHQFATTGAAPPRIHTGMFGYLQSALALDRQISPPGEAQARAAAVKDLYAAQNYLYEVKQRVVAYRAAMAAPPPPPVSPPPPPTPVGAGGGPPSGPGSGRPPLHEF
ncbi:MAG TPA: alkaline phosphatase family protein, partial [Phenylobacterium sp.]